MAGPKVRGDLTAGVDIAVLAPAELHKTMAYAAAKGIRDGLPVELIGGLSTFKSAGGGHTLHDSRAGRLSRLRTRIDQGQRLYLQARANANDPEVDEQLRADFMADAVSAHAAVAKLRAELAALEAEESSDQPLDAFDADADYVVAALANLAVCEGVAPAALQESLLTIIDELKWDIPARPLARGEKISASFYLRVPAQGGVARIGPIRFEVEHLGRLRPAKAVAVYGPLVRRLMEVTPALQTSTSSVAQRRRAARAARQILADAGLNYAATRVLIVCPQDEVVDVVCHLALGHRLRGSYAPAFIRRVADTYLDSSFGWQFTAWAHSAVARQLVVDTVVAAGGSMQMKYLYEALEGHPAVARDAIWRATVDMVSTSPEPTRARPWKAAVLAPRVRARRNGGSLVHAVRCPHADCPGEWASVVLRVPEVWRCLICPDCLREPVEDAPRLPDSYRALLPGAGSPLGPSEEEGASPETS